MGVKSGSAEEEAEFDSKEYTQWVSSLPCLPPEGGGKKQVPPGPGRVGEWATTLSLEVPGQQASSSHPVEKLCSHFLLNPKTLQSERRTRGTAGSQRVGANIVRR